MSEPKVDVYETVSGDLSVWVEASGAICIRPNGKFNDPVELGEREALELGALLLRLVREQRE